MAQNCQETEKEKEKGERRERKEKKKKEEEEEEEEEEGKKVRAWDPAAVRGGTAGGGGVDGKEHPAALDWVCRNRGRQTRGGWIRMSRSGRRRKGKKKKEGKEEEKEEEEQEEEGRVGVWWLAADPSGERTEDSALNLAIKKTIKKECLPRRRRNLRLAEMRARNRKRDREEKGREKRKLRGEGRDGRACKAEGKREERRERERLRVERREIS